MTPAMRPAAGRLGMTLLGIYLIAVGIVPYMGAVGLAYLVSLLAVAAGILILLGR